MNIGCLGLHLWPYLAADPAHADELRIDLDPTTGHRLRRGARVALLCRDVLEELGLRGLSEDDGEQRPARVPAPRSRAGTPCRCAPPRSRWPASSSAASRTSSPPTGGRRSAGSRVFVDFNQNAPHKTVFGAWFARPRTGGQVSTPLTWEEVETVVPNDLTIRTVPELVRRRGDPWADIAAAPQSIEPLLALAERDKEAGLHDAPWPPQYPKMPDEPPRVAPSRAKKA